MVPFAVNITGDPAFPHNGDVSTDVTISSPTTWTESNYPGRIVKLNRLDVDDVLTLQGGPWFIFVETLDFGASGSINGDGPDGALGTEPNADYARGGMLNNTARASGGSGGVMIFICANSITGTSSRTISASGGDGARNTSNAGASAAEGGQGALSSTYASGNAETWDGGVNASSTGVNFLHRFHMLMGDGGNSIYGGKGGGSGGITGSSDAGGGSGIGGGAGCESGSTTSGLQPIIDEPSVVALIELAIGGCLGGGGGGALISTTGANNAAGGGGGGSVVVWARTLTATPTLEANGGSSIGVSANSGAAGVTYLIDIP